MSAQESGTRNRVTLTGLNGNTSKTFCLILVKDFIFLDLHGPISASIMVKNGNFYSKNTVSEFTDREN